MPPINVPVQLFQLSPWISSLGPISVEDPKTILATLVQPCNDGKTLTAVTVNPDGSIATSYPGSTTLLQAMASDLALLYIASGAQITALGTSGALHSDLAGIHGDLAATGPIVAYLTDTIHADLHTTLHGDLYDSGNAASWLSEIYGAVSSGGNGVASLISSMSAKLSSGSSSGDVAWTLTAIYTILNDCYDATNHCLVTKVITP